MSTCGQVCGGVQAPIGEGGGLALRCASASSDTRSCARRRLGAVRTMSEASPADERKSDGSSSIAASSA